jgi:potassium/hydrogen antiporter
MIALHHIILGVSFLLLFSVIASKASGKFGVPALLVFLAIGMLAGAGGPGGIVFENARLAQSIGVVALALILFSGGMETEWKTVRPVIRKGIALSTLGVILAAALFGGFAVWYFHFSFLEGTLLGAIVSSTDAAAVFSVLKSRKISLKEPLRPLLELEAGSNDPMAVFLTLACLHLLTPHGTIGNVSLMFARQMVLGGLVGWGMGTAILLILNKVRLEYEGLYPVLTLALALLTYGIAATVGANGFLAVYLAGLVLGYKEFVHKRTLKRFHDGLAWLMQITMFLVLGLLVLPSSLPPIMGPGLASALFLILVARPVSVFVSLAFAKASLREKAMVSWVGLRGAAPIILATFPLVAGIPRAGMYFHLIFFIVVSSVLVQGPLIPAVARWLGVAVPMNSHRRAPLELERTEEMDADLEDFIVPYGSALAGTPLVQAGFPPGSLITLICRDGRYVIPSGNTELQEGDVLSVLVTPSCREAVHALFSQTK